MLGLAARLMLAPRGAIARRCGVLRAKRDGATCQATLWLPVTVQALGAAYLDVTVPGGGAKAWAGENALAVTITAFEGRRVTGTVAGTLPPAETNPGDPPLVVTDGKFSVRLDVGAQP